jgi:O-antigen ligase
MYKSTSELFEFNKMMFIYLIAVFVFIFWIIKIVKEKQFEFKRTFLDIPILVFLLSQTLSLFFSFDKYTSFFGFYGRFNGGLLSIVTYIFLFYAFINLFDFKRINQVVKTSLLSAFLVILWGIPGKFGYDLSCYLFLGQLNNSCWVNQFNPAERLFSTLGQPNWLGAFMAVNFFIALYFLFKEKASKFFTKKYLMYGGFIILSFITILFTRSRSSYLGVLIGSIVFLILYLKSFGQLQFKNTFFNKKYLLILFIFAISLFIFKTGIDKLDNFGISKKIERSNNTNSNQKTNLNEDINVTESFDIRKIVWKGAWQLGLKYPLFGSGVETFAYSYYLTRPQEHNLTSEWDFIYNKAHNEYLNYFATTGFVGIGSYLLMIGSVLFVFYKLIFSDLHRSRKLFYICLTSAYVSILVTNFFGFSTTTINIYFYLLPALLGVNVVHKKITLKLKRNFESFLGVIGTLLGLYFIIFLFMYYSADLYYSKAEKLSKAGDYQSTVQTLDQAINLHNSHVYLNSYALNLANLAVLASYQDQDADLKQYIDFSLDQINVAISKSPKNVNYWKNKSKIEYLLFQLDTSNTKYLNAAIDSLKKAQELSPTDPKVPYNLAIFYSILFDQAQDEKYKDLALYTIDFAIELKSDYRDAYFLKAQLYEKFGQKEEARNTLRHILNVINPKDIEASEFLNSL